MPVIQAREKINDLKRIDATSIKDLLILAYNDEKLADKIQNQWLLQETVERQRLAGS
ncbi:MAG: hypothetical protein ACK5QX_03525 [bacterium]|jgi:hypothetical protein